MFSVKNKVVIVTGSSGGNGSAIVKGLEKLGAIVEGGDLPSYDITTDKHRLCWDNTR